MAVIENVYISCKMLKKIRHDEIRLGMFVHSIEGNWLEHPFWKTSFLITRDHQLQALKDAAINAIWIDTSKGVDTLSPPVDTNIVDPPPHETSDTAAESPSPVAAPDITSEQSSQTEEYRNAVAVLAKAKTHVAQMLHETRMGKVICVAEQLPLIDEIRSSINRDNHAILSLARLKKQDEYTYMHSVSVCALMVALGQQIDLDEEQIRIAGLAGLLHDLGKIMIPDDILNKPGALTDEEFAIMRTHPAHGHLILKKTTNMPKNVLDVCRHHHEKIDATGYPDKLAGESISLFARMGAICDVYDAITSDRPYKSHWEASSSIARMATWKGHFDTQLLQAFIRTVGIYPTGTLVRLKSDRLAVVLRQNNADLTSPVVKVFFSTKFNHAISIEIIDLHTPSCQDYIVSREDPAHWKFPELTSLWLN